MHVFHGKAKTHVHVRKLPKADPQTLVFYMHLYMANPNVVPLPQWKDEASTTDELAKKHISNVQGGRFVSSLTLINPQNALMRQFILSLMSFWYFNEIKQHICDDFGSDDKNEIRPALGV